MKDLLILKLKKRKAIKKASLSFVIKRHFRIMTFNIYLKSKNFEFNPKII